MEHGTGQHSHAVPLRDGLIVEMRDGQHEGTGIYWSEARQRYVFVSYDRKTVVWRKHCMLLRGPSAELDGEAFACDLESPDGLAIIGYDDEADLHELYYCVGMAPPSADSVLWDSRAAAEQEAQEELGVSAEASDDVPNDAKIAIGEDGYAEIVR